MQYRRAFQQITSIHSYLKKNFGAVINLITLQP